MSILKDFLYWWAGVASGILSAKIYDDLIVKPSLTQPLSKLWIRRRRIEEELLNGHPFLYPEEYK